MAQNHSVVKNTGKKLQQTANNYNLQQIQSSLEHQILPISQNEEETTAPTLPSPIEISTPTPENSKISSNQDAIKIQQQGEHRMRSSMIDHQVSNKFKPAQRRNTIQMTPSGTATPTARKPSLTKMSSLINIEEGGGKTGGCVISENTSKQHQQYNQNQSTPNNVVARTTSESLRLNVMPTSTNETHNLSNATSNSSLERVTYSSSSSSNAPRSTPNTFDSLSSEVTSPKNNISSADASSSNASRSRHSHGQSHNILGTSSPLQRKPKTTSSSFQITSVTVGQGKKSSDNGEESADDLDESHTEENSRTIDLENDFASMSEDTFSKDEVFYANSALSSTAPAIPTSSQYGLVVVDPIGPTSGQQIQNVQVNVGENIINVVSAAVTPGGSKKKEDIKETQHRSERFKVVKIESTEPFRRGRWMCMDYLDHSTVGNGVKESNNDKTATAEGTGVNGEQAKTTQSMIIGTGASVLLENHTDTSGNSLQMNNAIADVNWNFSTGTTAIVLESTSPNHQQLSQQISGPSGIATAPATIAPGMPHAQSFLKSIEKEQLQVHQQAGASFDQHSQFEPQNSSYSDTVNKNKTSTTAEPVVDFATAAAQQLQKSLQQLKQQEDAIAAVEAVAAQMYAPGESQHINFTHIQQQQQTSTETQVTNTKTATEIPNLNFQKGITISVESNQTSPASQHQPQQEPQLQSEQNLSQLPNTVQESGQLSTHHMTYAEVAQQNAQQQLHSQKQLNIATQQSAASSYVAQQQPTVPTHALYEDVKIQQHQQTHAAASVASNAIVIPHTLQQQLSQTDGIATTTILQHSQPTQFQQTAQGQTMPILTQITAYDVQPQQHQQTTLQQAPPQLQSAPATLADPNALIASLQAVQRQQQGSGLENIMGQMATGVSGVSANDLQQHNIAKHLTTNANITTIANVMNMIKTNAATCANSGDDLTQQQLQQQQQTMQSNTESETER